VDFLPRPWIAHSGWPIRRADVDPWYERAFPILDIPPRHRFDEVEVDRAVHPRLLGADHPDFQSLLWLKSPPTRMGTKYRAEIAGSPRIRCYLRANAVELVPDGDARAVRTLRARTLAGRDLLVQTSHYALGAGGIENARLLLLSDSVVTGGLGNRHDLVGRFFLEHLAQVAGSMVLVSPRGVRGFQEEVVLARARRDLAGVWDLFFGFATTPRVREEHRLLGFAVNAVPRPPRPDGSEAAIEDLLGDGAATGRARAYTLGILAERAPNAASRVTLATERDALGARKIVLDLQPGTADRRSADKALRLFALEIARSGHGRVRIHQEDETNLLGLTGHHMGTTRMADDPRDGVTDRDGRVHGIDNLWVAGSSLFPTGGYANPTLTIVALALRQAARLHESLQSAVH
jgi:choline dehydrogenase-like flavoprotein